MRPGRPLPTLVVAAALALGAAISLGLARFSYALLLPPMRADLGWSYLTAGAMNTVNAAGYLAGALAAPRGIAPLRRARRVFLGGARRDRAGAARRTASSSATRALYALRFVTGVGSAGTFVAGGLLAARLVAAPARTARPARARGSGLVLGIYYGGTGVGIVASALLVPVLVERGGRARLAGAWLGLGGARWRSRRRSPRWRRAPARRAGGRRRARAARARVRLALALAPALVAYLLFGLGYIGYMTFVVTLLREQRLAGGRDHRRSSRCSASR